MSENRSLIGRFFGFIWKATLFLFRAMVVLSMIATLFVVWTLVRGSAPAVVEDNVALIVAPTGTLVEQVDEDPTVLLMQDVTGEMPSQSRLRDVVEALHRARDDARITFAVLKLDGLWSAGLPQLDELAEAMREFRATGKKIVAYGPWYDQSHYYLAAQADEVVMDPFGVVAIEGFSLYNNFYKEAIDKLGIDVHVFRVGEYKSAVEPFTRTDMSAEAKAANREWLGDLWRGYGAAVAAGRQLPTTAVDDYVSGLADGLRQVGGDAARYAKDKGLITHVEALNAFRQRMGQVVGLDEEHGSFRQIHYLDYLGATQVEHLARQPRGEQNKVALVVVQGEIVDGFGQVGQAGGTTIADLLDQARMDEDVKAVVLRVDSPGGSVWASEQIRRAVQQLKAEGKPVVASMSSVAASGGYWVSMDADQIWAHPSTITGSIGIFGMIPTLDRSLAKLGIRTDGVGTTQLAGAFRLDRPLSPELGQIIQSQIEKGYSDFINGVAQARELPVEKVSEIARGRVWSGADAKELGLIDEFGSLEGAADAAATLAGLDVQAYVLDERQPPRDFATELLMRFSGSIRIDGLPGVSAWLQRWARQADLEQVLRGFNDPRGQYALCFCTPSAGGRNR
jgi:protease-4